MKCWKCGQESGEGLCPHCGADQTRPAPVTEAGKAMRSLYDRYGCREVLANSVYLVNGLGDLLPEAKKLRNQMKMAMDAGAGRLYLEQLDAGAPDAAFDRRVKTLLTEEAGLSDAVAGSLSACFDEMIGWRSPSAPPEGKKPDLQTEPPEEPVRTWEVPRDRSAGEAFVRPTEQEITRAKPEETKREERKEEPQAADTWGDKPPKRGLLLFEIAAVICCGAFWLMAFISNGNDTVLIVSLIVLMGLPVALSFVPSQKTGRAPVLSWIFTILCGLVAAVLVYAAPQVNATSLYVIAAESIALLVQFIRNLRTRY